MVKTYWIREGISAYTENIVFRTIPGNLAFALSGVNAIFYSLVLTVVIIYNIFSVMIKNNVEGISGSIYLFFISLEGIKTKCDYQPDEIN